MVPKEEAASVPAHADAPGTTGNTNSKPSSGKKTSKSEAEIYHERVGCGLFWAVGKFRPTNYMIVSRDLPVHLHSPDAHWDHRRQWSVPHHARI